MQKKKERTVEILTLKQHPKGLAVRLALKKKPKNTQYLFLNIDMSKGSALCQFNPYSNFQKPY